MLAQPISKNNQILRLLLAGLFSVSIASAQQSNCSIRLDRLPDASELRGFHLGMTYDQVKSRVPQIRFGRADEFGVSKTSISPFFDPSFDKASFADVRTISLDFLDGKLVTLWIGYESTFKWKTLGEFVAGISKSLNLPAEWAAKRGGRQLTCEGFSILVSLIGGGPSIRVTDETAQEIIATRREAAAAAAELVIGDKATRLYYPSDCSALENVAVSNRVTFKDKDEAAKAGYKIAKDCQ
ncbi:MAG: hypothetical protein AUJ04_06580 [Acidobacteria bacterium 13_1_40CM_3_55_6]|nr:MAG: hypothetical protein AUJ04_06580 [Acidobacteria bacterium 13_1_40CM_3_55_6]PYS62504.1 MAG: hypothetical protein DMF74_13015 [Acidobacteriota bacterium]